MSKNIVLAYDNGGTNLRSFLIGREGEIIRKVEENVSDFNSNTQLTDMAISMGNNLITKSSLTMDDICGVGIDSAGVVDGLSIKNAPNIEIDPITLPEDLKNNYGKPTFALNDCAAGAYGAWMFGHGKGKNLSRVGYVTLSTGTNMNLVIDGEIYNDKMEWGHDIIDATNMGEDGCGHYGHREAYISGTGVRNLYLRELGNNLGIEISKGHKELPYALEIANKRVKDKGIARPQLDQIKDELEAKDIYLAAREGKDNVAMNIVQSVVPHYLAMSLGSIISNHQPQLIEIGGSMMHDDDLLLSPAIRLMGENPKEYTLVPMEFWPEMLKTGHMDSLLGLGAAAYTFSRLDNKKAGS